MEIEDLIDQNGQSTLNETPRNGVLRARQKHGQRRWEKPGFRTGFCENGKEGGCSDPEQRMSSVQNTCTSIQGKDSYEKS